VTGLSTYGLFVNVFWEMFIVFDLKMCFNVT
jgi:hypothetical protein